jgi:hypothetical protein
MHALQALMVMEIQNVLSETMLWLIAGLVFKGRVI